MQQIVFRQSLPNRRYQPSAFFVIILPLLRILLIIASNENWT